MLRQQKKPLICTYCLYIYTHEFKTFFDCIYQLLICKPVCSITPIVGTFSLPVKADNERVYYICSLDVYAMSYVYLIKENLRSSNSKDLEISLENESQTI